MSRKQNEDNSMINSCSKIINDYINKENLTNKELGEILGVDEATIRKYKKGETLPSHATTKKILSLMKIRYHELMGFNDPKEE